MNAAAQKLPPLTDPYSDASAYHSRPLERHNPSTDGGHGPQRLNNFPPNASSWHGLRLDHDVRANERHKSEAPLTLQIPNGVQGKYIFLRGDTTLIASLPLCLYILTMVGVMIDLPSISPAYATTTSDGYPFHSVPRSNQIQVSSLPTRAKQCSGAIQTVKGKVVLDFDLQTQGIAQASLNTFDVVLIPARCNS